jgi:ABC-type transport system involved in cytochrome c biogenesis permease subunit
LAFYAVSGALTLRRLRSGGSSPATHRANYLAMLCGFALHTAFLIERGQAMGRCPLTNLFETQIFVAWAAVLFYLVVGPAYRVSFLGAFTAPLVLAICLAALVAGIDVPGAEPLARSPWVEFHAAMAIVAYGAFALAFVAGAMYLMQERQLKTRRLGPAFLQMPSIEQLDQINLRLILLGFAMLSVGMIGGFISYRIVGHWATAKIVWAITVWLVYAALLAARLGWSVRGRRVAVISMLSFAFVLVTFWSVNLISP